MSEWPKLEVQRKKKAKRQEVESVRQDSSSSGEWLCAKEHVPTASELASCSFTSTSIRPKSRVDDNLEDEVFRSPTMPRVQREYSSPSLFSFGNSSENRISSYSGERKLSTPPCIPSIRRETSTSSLGTERKWSSAMRRKTSAIVTQIESSISPSSQSPQARKDSSQSGWYSGITPKRRRSSVIETCSIDSRESSSVGRDSWEQPKLPQTNDSITNSVRKVESRGVFRTLQLSNVPVAPMRIQSTPELKRRSSVPIASKENSCPLPLANNISHYNVHAKKMILPKEESNIETTPVKQSVSVTISTAPATPDEKSMIKDSIAIDLDDSTEDPSSDGMSIEDTQGSSALSTQEMNNYRLKPTEISPPTAPPPMPKRKLTGLASRLSSHLSILRSDRIMARRDSHAQTTVLTPIQTVSDWGISLSSLSSSQSVLVNRRGGEFRTVRPAPFGGSSAPSVRVACCAVLPLPQIRLPHRFRPSLIIDPILVESRR